MSSKFIRVYQPFDINHIKEHLLIHGDLSSSCANCGAIDLKLNMASCPECHAEFKYISFRNVKNHLPKLIKLHSERPSVAVIDFEDYQKQSGSSKAEDFFK